MSKEIVFFFIVFVFDTVLMTASIPIILSFFFCHIISITLSVLLSFFRQLVPSLPCKPFYLLPNYQLSQNDALFHSKRCSVYAQILRRYCSHFGKKVILLAVIFRI